MEGCLALVDSFKQHSVPFNLHETEIADKVELFVSKRLQALVESIIQSETKYVALNEVMQLLVENKTESISQSPLMKSVVLKIVSKSSSLTKFREELLGGYVDVNIITI